MIVDIIVINPHSTINNSNIKSVKISNGVTSIGYAAFSNCSSLKSIKIPNSVKSIYKDAFDDCYYLTSVFYSGSQNEWSNISIDRYNSYLTNANIHYNSNGDYVWNSGKTTKEATYVTEGEKQFEYSVYGETKTAKIKTKEHSYSKATTKATTSKNGKVVKILIIRHGRLLKALKQNKK